MLDRRRAEALFALAIITARSGYLRAAKGFAEECVLLLQQIGMDTREDCATHATHVQGVLLPEFLHTEVVHDRLRAYNVRLGTMTATLN
jgi:hypothetical protein